MLHWPGMAEFRFKPHRRPRRLLDFGLAAFIEPQSKPSLRHDCSILSQDERPIWNGLWASLGLTVLVFTASIASALEPCRVEVVERGSGWPVPLVELRTTHLLRFVTDNGGLIAIDQPDLMGREIWFDVLGHGYEVPRDGLGQRGVRLTPEPGRSLRVEVARTIIAKRLGRITGAGLFAESQKLGLDRDWAETGIFGCDSVQNAIYHGRLFWAWGDTTLPFYPLGIFHMSSATTDPQPLRSFQPPLHLSFDYFRDAQGKPKGVAKMPGDGPTWVSGVVTLPDQSGSQRLVGTYLKIKPPMESYESGLCVWNDGTMQFDQVKVLWTKTDVAPNPPPSPQGHPLLWKDEHGAKWVLFGNPLPKLRCRATFESWQDPASWQPVLSPDALTSATDGTPVQLHSGSLAWNEFRRRFVTVFMQTFGTPSPFGELWYAESATPFGPWGKAVKVLSHDNYTFYNPRLHPEFTPASSPILLFEGTFTMAFVNQPRPTPRYDYNQILYRLDLNDPALAAAQGP